MRAMIVGLSLCLAAPAWAGSCLVEVQGQRYLDGSCDIRRSDRGFIVAKPGGGQAAAVHIDPFDSNRGHAGWNGRMGDRPDGQGLGPMRREGSCWVNDKAKVCAW